MEETNKNYQRNYFSFVCKLNGDDVSKMVKESGKTTRINIPVTDGKGVLYVEVVHFGEQDNVYYKDKNNKFVSVEWSDRHDVVDAHFSSVLTLNINGKKEETVSVYDFANSLLKHISDGDLTDKTLALRGEVKIELGKENKKYTKYELKQLAVIPDGTPLVFKTETSAVIKKGAVKVDEENKKIILNGFTQNYMKLDGEQSKRGYMVPEDFILSYVHENEKTSQMRKQLYLKLFDVKDDNLHAVLFDCEIFKGANEVKVLPLTDEQKMFISLDLLTEEEAIENNTVKDNKVTTELRVVRPVLKTPYEKVTYVIDNKDTIEKMIFELKAKVDEVDEVTEAFGETVVDSELFDSWFN